MAMFDDVRAFHQAFGQRAADRPGLPDAAERAMRRKLLAEEVQEYREAEEADDLAGVAGELTDIAYIVCGTAVSYGLGPKGEYVALFARLGGPGLPPRPARAARIAAINRKFEEYRAAEERDDLAAVSTALGDLMESVFTCATLYGIPLLRVFDAVHRANMAKLHDGVALRREDGKVLKPAGWAAPDIARVLFPGKPGSPGSGSPEPDSPGAPGAP